MTFNMKKFSGVLVAAGLVAACGGEERNADGARGDTGRVESRSTSDTTTITTDLGESVTCYTAGIQGYETGTGCYLASGFSHQYHTGYSVNFEAKENYHQFIPYSGLFGSGYLAGDQSLYVGPNNGMVTFKGDTTISIAGYTLQERMVSGGTLAQDTCLMRSNGTKAACAGGYSVGFWAPPNGPSIQGYLYSCQPTTNITCP